MPNNYNADSIKHLSTKEAMRTRIQVYLGSDDTEGIYQALKEIINNSTDEAIAGFGDRIEITFNSKDNSIQVQDYGRGIPYQVKDGKNLLVSIFTESHTGGKFDKKSYKNSSGLNGLASTAVCASSSYFKVRTSRDGGLATAEFKQGELLDYKEEKWTDPNTSTGTYIFFIPDKEVFKNMTDGYSFERICSEVENIAYLNRKIHFILKDVESGKKVEYYSENGIADFIKAKVEKPLMKSPIIVTKTDGIDEVEVAFMWTAAQSASYVFVNGLYCPEGGSPITGAKRTLTTSIRRLSGENLDPELIRKGLVYAINCKVLEPSFASQIKSKVNNPSLTTLTSAAFKEGLEEFSVTPEFKDIIEVMKRYQKAERAADKARIAVMEHNKDLERELKKPVLLADKLADCKYHDERSQLLICEGKLICPYLLYH